MCTIKQPPGKFQGETCITHLMHAWAMDGTLDHEDCQCADNDDNGDGECGCTPVDVAFAPFTLDDIRQYNDDADDAMCAECEVDFLAASRIRYWEDSQGFAYSEVL